MIKKYKGYYEAVIRMELNEESNLPLEEIKKNMENMAEAIKSVLKDEIGVSENSTITVTQTKGDVWES